MSAIGQGDAPPQEPAPSTPPSEGAPPPTTEAPPAAPPPDFDRLYSRMDEMSAQQRAMAEQMAQAFAPPEEEVAYYDDTGEMTEEGAQALIQELVSEQVKAALAPHEQSRLIRERDDAYEDLKDRYPELADEKIGGAVLRDAINWAQRNNPDLIDRPEFVDLIEWVYKAEHRTPEAPQIEETRRVELESAAGAGGSRGRAKPEVDWGERIVKAADRLRPQI